jgi:hypothetical protein
VSAFRLVMIGSAALTLTAAIGGALIREPKKRRATV